MLRNLRIRLGLVGAGISRSKSPLLHELAGEISGLDVTYDLFDLNAEGLDGFEQILEAKEAGGYVGLNVTHPMKERAFHLVEVKDPEMAEIGSVNTIRFIDQAGFNTDYTGFMKAYRSRWGDSSPGSVLLVGAGGVGRAIAFALLKLDSKTRIYVSDQYSQKSDDLARSLIKFGGWSESVEPATLDSRASEMTGIVNCTPVGMHGHPGTPLRSELLGEQAWAFDAVYTPVETEFLSGARNRGLEVMSGYELFFHQGVDAFERFTGVQVDEHELRKRLLSIDE